MCSMGALVVLHERKDRRTHTIKLVVHFRNLSSASESHWSVPDKENVEEEIHRQSDRNNKKVLTSSYVQ